MKILFLNKIKSVPKYIWILSVIVLFGIFLRAYNFHAWLDFGSDQVNDATRAGAVVENKAPWPSYGPDMGNSGKGGRSNRFRLGPIYYDFEIISAKIFGNNPVSMAYPDLIFSILSIPLFFLFLRIVFATNLSLALTGLYAISFYALSFSHSAWNVNSIPFFSLLFLLGLYELILAKEKADWKWIIALGISLGVSVQLHAILLILFPATLFFASIIYLRKNPKVWKKLAIVIVIMFVLNLGQIVSERRNGFLNSKIFLESVTGSSTTGGDSFAVKFANNVSCNIQANAFMLSAVGKSDCNFALSQFIGGGGNKKLLKIDSIFGYILMVLLFLAFSIAGYALLINRLRKEEKQEKRYFWGLILLYMGLSFFVMLPIIDSAIRYFVHAFFLPFLLFGLIVDFLGQKYLQKFQTFKVLLFVTLFISNFFAIYLEVRDNFSQSRIILGTTEQMVEYMVANSDNKNEIYLYGSAKAGDFFKSLKYVMNNESVNLLRAANNDKLPVGSARFYLNTGKEIDSKTRIDVFQYDHYRVFDDAVLFHLVD